MYNEEIVQAICDNHLYEYCIVNANLEVIKYSKNVSKYCDSDALKLEKIELFDMVPELVGMEEDLALMFEGASERLLIPMVFKSPKNYINIRVHPNQSLNTVIVLFENITKSTQAQHDLQQANNSNLLLLEEIAMQNRQLEAFNKEMQKLVDEEVAKNLEKQHAMELQTRHAQMGEMIGMITHQWKQPLSAIQTIGTLLKMKSELGKLKPELVMSKVDNILTQVTYMNETVNDFQKFFTPSKKKVSFHVKDVVTSVVRLVEVEYAIHGIRMIIEGDDEVHVYGYANEYKQVILAILQNAKDALLSKNSKEGMIIIIKISSEGSASLVTINDNAGGIDKEMLETIFTQYMTTKDEGSGLGLHIAKSVIENNMHGKLWVENDKVGAKFSILV